MSTSNISFNTDDLSQSIIDEKIKELGVKDFHEYFYAVMNHAVKTIQIKKQKNYTKIKRKRFKKVITKRHTNLIESLSIEFSTPKSNVVKVLLTTFDPKEFLRQH